MIFEKKDRISFFICVIVIPVIFMVIEYFYPCFFQKGDCTKESITWEEVWGHKWIFFIGGFFTWVAYWIREAWYDDGKENKKRDFK